MPEKKYASRGQFRLHRQITFGCMVLPGTALYIMFFIVPIIWGIYYSFTNPGKDDAPHQAHYYDGFDE